MVLEPKSKGAQDTQEEVFLFSCLCHGRSFCGTLYHENCYILLTTKLNNLPRQEVSMHKTFFSPFSVYLSNELTCILGHSLLCLMDS